MRMVLLSGVLCVLLPSLVRADEIYTFSGSITPYSGLPSGATQSFSVTLPGFITQDTFVSAAALSACSTGYSATCVGINFLPSSPGWGAGPGQVVQIAFMDGVVNPNYYFPLNAFTVNGTYSTVVLQSGNVATLSVTPVTAVPEPATCFLVLGPLSVFIARRCRRLLSKDSP